MARRKNKRRIDPRYFLNETTYRDEIEDGTIDEGFFGDLGDKMGLNTSTTKRRIKNLEILRNNWKSEIGDARYFDQQQFDDLITTTGKALAAAGVEGEVVARVVNAIGSGDGSTASDAVMAALAGRAGNSSVVGDLSNLFMNGVPEIAQAVGEEEARRSAARLADQFAAMQKDIDKTAKFRGQERDAEIGRRDANRQARDNAAASEKQRKDNEKYGRGDY